MDIQNTSPQAWYYYELGKVYNESLSPNQYDLVNTNIEFFAGNQWIHLPETPAMQKLPKPVFNILKRVSSLFIASLTSSAATVSFEPLTYYDGENLNDPETNASVYATAEVRNLFEKFKMDYRIREALFDGAQTGDYAAHFYFDPDALPYGGAFGAYRGEIQMELVDGINVMFGNPAEDNIEKQPYVILVGRDTVGNLKDEIALAKKQKMRKDDDEYCEIMPDRDNVWFAGQGARRETGAMDDSGKCTYVYLYTKKTKEEPLIDPATGKEMMEDVYDSKGNIIYEKGKDGKELVDMQGNKIPKRKVAKHRVTSVYVTKATRSAVIYEDVDTGLSCYPIAFGNWEKQKNQYHGRALVTGMIPNQIYLNKMFALMMRHVELCSMSKYIYDADKIQHFSSEVGQAIAVRNMQPGQSLESVASIIRPAEMSAQIINAIDKTMAYTKECLGATDAQMGSVKPENTSALMVLQNAGEVPLENIRALLYEWLEDCATILLDMMGTYYGERPIVREKDFDEPLQDAAGNPMIDPTTGQMQTQKVKRRVVEMFDFSQFKNLWFNVRVDVGATSYYSELATVQTLDNLRRDGTLDVIDYLERIPDKFVPRKQELIEKLQQAQGMQAQQQAQQQASANMIGISPSANGEMTKENAFAKLTPSQQKNYADMPSTAKRALTQLAKQKM